MAAEKYLMNLIVPVSLSTYGEKMAVNTNRNSPFVKYLRDRLTVKYVGRGLAYPDVAAVQSNLPANPETLIYYYEVKVNHISNQSRSITVGFSDVDFPLNKHPGFTKRSYSYRADGKAYHAKSPSEVILPKFENECVVGCGLNYLKNEIFFTFNGKYFGPVFGNVEPGDFYPTVGIDSINEAISFNFGGKKPFKFDIDTFIGDQKKEVVREILGLDLHHFDVHRVVQSYLYYAGYKGTIDAFEEASQMESRKAYLPPNDLMSRHSEGKNGQVEQNGQMLDERGRSKSEMIIEGENGNGDDMMMHGGDSMMGPTFNMRKQSENIIEDPDTNNQAFGFYSPPVRPARKESNVSELNENIFFRETSNDYTNYLGASGGKQSTSLLRQSSNGTNGATSTDLFAIKERSELRELFLDGKIPEARDYLRKAFPAICERDPEVEFVFDCQSFVELIRAGENTKALEFAQTTMSKYVACNYRLSTFDAHESQVEIGLEDLMGLLCYEFPEQSPLRHLLTKYQREFSFARINMILMKNFHYSEKSIIEILFSQLQNISSASKENSFIVGHQFKVNLSLSNEPTSPHSP